MAEQLTIQPVFDPANVGASLDRIKAQLSIKRPQLQGAVVGDTTSLRKGEGYDMDGVRGYEVGDDPRYIDWRVTARQTDDELLVREHFHDITPNLWILTDMLQSRHTVNPGYFSEQNLALSAVTAMMRIADAQLMPTAMIAANNERLAVRHKTPREGRQHVRRTIHELAAALPVSEEPKKGGKFRNPRPGLELQKASVTLADTLKYAAKHCIQDMVVVVSDFRDVAAPDDIEHGWQQPLKQLAKQGNDIIAIELTNPHDYELPAEATRFLTSNGVIWVGQDKKSQVVRAAFKEAAAAQQEAIDTTLLQAKARHLKLSTADPLWLTSLRKQLRVGAARKLAA